jgi:phosphate acetyltransferase
VLPDTPHWTAQSTLPDPDAAIADIVDRFHDVADRCDAVVIVGSDYTDVTTPSELDTNARIAANLGAPVVLAVKAKDRTPEEVAQVVELCLVEIAGQHAHTAAVVANRCEPANMAAVAEALKRFPPKSYVLPEEPLLVAPAVFYYIGFFRGFGLDQPTRIFTGS